jgi:hypothetical protein
VRQIDTESADWAPERTSKRRRQVIVLPQLQKRLILRVALLPTLALAALGAIIAVEAMLLLREAAAAEVELVGVRRLLLTVCGFIIVVGVMLVHHAVHLSHRVGGPAYRFLCVLHDLRHGGEPKPIKLRRGDFLGEVADEYNLLVDTWQADRTTQPPAAAAAGTTAVSPANPTVTP